MNFEYIGAIFFIYSLIEYKEDVLLFLALILGPSTNSLFFQEIGLGRKEPNQMTKQMTKLHLYACILYSSLLTLLL